MKKMISRFFEKIFAAFFPDEYEDECTNDDGDYLPKTQSQSDKFKSKHALEEACNSCCQNQSSSRTSEERAKT